LLSPYLWKNKMANVKNVCCLFQVNAL
jgi:hypothetical protein